MNRRHLLLIFAAIAGVAVPLGNYAHALEPPAASSSLQAALANSRFSVVPARPHPAVLRIHNQCNSHTALGTGTLIQSPEHPGLVITCGHLFDQGVGSISVVTPAGDRYKAELLGADLNNDLAALAVNISDIEPVEVRDSTPRVGDTLTSSGYGETGKYAYNRGRVTGYAMREGANKLNLVEIVGIARHGDSGGPMLDSSGRLAGVLIGTDGNVVDGIATSIIHEFLAELPQSTPEASVLAKQLGLNDLAGESTPSKQSLPQKVIAGRPVSLPDTAFHQIRGRVVVGKNGVPRAKVELVGSSVEATTDHDGNFVLRNVPSGTYRIWAEGIALNKRRRGSIQVELGTSGGYPAQVIVKIN